MSFADPEATRRWVRDRKTAARPGFARDRRQPDPWPPPLRDSREEAPPYAEIERGGWGDWIHVYHGVFKIGPDGGAYWHLGTRASAERRAARLVERVAVAYEREKAPRHRVEPIPADAYRRAEELRTASAAALVDLRDPEGAWEREYSQLEARTPRRRLALFRRR